MATRRVSPWAPPIRTGGGDHRRRLSCLFALDQQAQRQEGGDGHELLRRQVLRHQRQLRQCCFGLVNRLDIQQEDGPGILTKPELLDFAFEIE
jgi:hypothetical protein